MTTWPLVGGEPVGTFRTSWFVHRTCPKTSENRMVLPDSGAQEGPTPIPYPAFRKVSLKSPGLPADPLGLLDTQHLKPRSLT